MKTCTDRQPAPARPLLRYSLHGQTMGTRYSAVFHAHAGLDQAALNRRLFAAVDAVDRQMSPWKPDSDLNRLNAAALREWVPLPRQLLHVLECALHISRQSAGSFDIGVGDLVNAWGFGPASQQPDAARITALQAQPRRLAADVLCLDQTGRRALKLAPVTLDLCGIAKGYGVDQLARCLDEQGIDNYLVGIDGEMRARGLKPDGKPWVLAVEKPLRGVREVMAVMELSDAAIATSGDYRHWVDFGGRSFSHSMHPQQQAPLPDVLAAVSVIESSCMLADAWATALLVAGPQAGPALAQARGMTALFLLRDGDGCRELSVVDGQLQP